MAGEFDLGPKMRVLTEKQQAFVLYLVANPGCSNAEAARAAGYSDSTSSARVTGHHLIHDQRIIEAMHECAGKRLWGLALKATAKLDKLLDSDDEGVVTKAAVALLDRTGFGAVQNINVNQTVTDQSGKAIMERIRALAEKHGLDERKLLGKDSGPKISQESPAPIDVEFSEVKE